MLNSVAITIYPKSNTLTNLKISLAFWFLEHRLHRSIRKKSCTALCSVTFLINSVIHCKTNKQKNMADIVFILHSVCVCVMFEACFLNLCVCVCYLIPTPPALHRKSRPAGRVCPGANEQLSLASVLLGFT